MKENEHLYLRDSKVMDSDQSSPNRLLVERNLQAAGGGTEGERERPNGYFAGEKRKGEHVSGWKGSVVTRQRGNTGDNGDRKRKEL